MKDYKEMAESIFDRRDKYAVEKRKQTKKLTTTISCVCLCAVLGVGAWQNGIFDSVPVEAGGTAIVPGGATAPVENSAGTEQLEQTQPAFINGTENSASEGFDSDRAGAWVKEDTANNDKEFSVGCTPLAPPATCLTQSELYDAAGEFLPDKAPDGFLFESASLTQYGYSVIWYRDLEELDWYIRDYKDEDAQRITSVADTKNYDLALYPIPRADSVPEELREIVDNPIFRAEELTQEAVYARAYQINDANDSTGYRMHFSVLYGDKVISVTSKGVSPQWLFAQLKALPRTWDVPVHNEVGSTGELTPFDEVWGGSYLDADGRLVIWLTEDTPENRAEVYKRNAAISENSTAFKKADYSLAYLTQLMAHISKAMVDKQLPFVSSAALREDLNRIEVSMTEETAALIKQVQALDPLGGAIVFRNGASDSFAVKEVLEEAAQ